MFSHDRKSVHPIIRNALTPLILALIIYTGLIYAPPPIEITRIASFRTSYIVMAAFTLFFFIVWKQYSLFWKTASFTLTLVVFSLPILYKWQTSFYDGNLIGGLLPWSDAGNYFNCGSQLLIRGEIDAWCARRPIFPLFWGVIYGITGLDLKISIAILVALNAIAVHLAAQEIRQASHSLSSAIYLLFSFIYYYNYAGTVLTENLGFALGSIAVACLLYGNRQNNEKTSTLGLLLLSLALNARAGAFLIIPLLLLWFINRFRGKHSTWSLAIVGFTTAAFPFLLNAFFLKTLAEPGSVALANYVDTLYGLASGNKGWLQIYIDHPGVPETEFLALTIEKIKENPWMLIKGIFGAYGDYFKPIGAFTYLTGPSSQPRNILLWIAFVISLFMAWAKRKDGLYNLMLFAFVGIFLSVGLLPPKDADVRAYAATIPLTNLIFSIGVVAFLRIEQILPDQSEKEPQHNEFLLIAFAVLLTLVITFGPYFVRSSLDITNPNQLPVNCIPEQEYGLSIISGKSSTILLGEFSETYSPMVRSEDFINGINSGGIGWYPNLDAALLNLEQGDTLTIGFDLTTDKAIYLISPDQPLPGKTASICATPTEDETLQAYSFYYYTPVTTSKAPTNINMLDSYQPSNNIRTSVRYIQIILFILMCLMLIKDTAHVYKNSNINVP